MVLLAAPVAVKPPKPVVRMPPPLKPTIVTTNRPAANVRTLAQAGMQPTATTKPPRYVPTASVGITGPPKPPKAKATPAPHGEPKNMPPFTYNPPPIKAQPPKKTAPPKGSAAAPKPPVDPLLAEATAQAHAGIDPQLKAIQDQIDAEERDRQAQKMAAEGVMAALAAYSAGLPEDIKQAYLQAANAQYGYATGVTGAMDANTAAGLAAENTQIANLGAPGSVTSQEPDMSKVAMYLGGTMPASNLAAEAANRYTEAQFLRVASGQTIADKSIADMAVTQQQIDTLRQKGIDINSTLPSEIQKAYNVLVDEDLKRQAATRAAAKIDPTLSAGMGHLVHSDGTPVLVKDPKTGQLVTVPYAPYTKPQGLIKVGSSQTGWALIDPVTHETVWSAKGTGPPPRTISTKNGSFQYDAATNSWIPIPGTAPAAGGVTDWQTRVIGGKVYLFDKKNGTFHDPMTGQIVNPNAYAGQPKLTASQKTQAANMVAGLTQGYYGVAGSGGANKLPDRLTDVQLSKFLGQYNKNAKAAGTPQLTLKQFKQSPKAMRSVGVIPVHAADVSAQDQLTNKLYLQLTQLFKQAGADPATAREQAFNYVAQTYSGWAFRNANSFFPQGGGDPNFAGNYTAPGGGFLPQGAKYVEGRADAGRDFQTNAGGAILAPGAGYVIQVGGQAPHVGFGADYPVVHFTSGPYAGLNMYIGHTHSALANHAKFEAGAVLAHTGYGTKDPKGVGNATKPGWAEIGFWNQGPRKSDDPAGTPFGSGSTYQPKNVPPDYTGGGGYTTGHLQPYQAQAYAKTQMLRFGWNDAYWPALQQLWQGESGWDYTRKNPHSGALGIPQAVGHTLPANYATSAQTQIVWGLNYIKNRYGDPLRALAFWNATVHKDPSLAPSDLQNEARIWISKGYAGY